MGIAVPEQVRGEGTGSMERWIANSTDSPLLKLVRQPGKQTVLVQSLMDKHQARSGSYASECGQLSGTAVPYRESSVRSVSDRHTCVRSHRQERSR
jgi:hypothetical protein